MINPTWLVRSESLCVLCQGTSHPSTWESPSVPLSSPNRQHVLHMTVLQPSQCCLLPSPHLGLLYSDGPSAFTSCLDHGNNLLAKAYFSFPLFLSILYTEPEYLLKCTFSLSLFYSKSLVIVLGPQERTHSAVPE